MSAAPAGFPDNHNHFLMSGEPAPMVEAAARAGLTDIVLSEHIFHLDEAREETPYLVSRWTPEGEPLPLADYVAKVRGAAEDAPLGVLLGLELDVRAEDPGFEAWSDGFVARRDDWDVLLGSVHTLSDDVGVQDEPIGRVAEDAWRDYLGRVKLAAASGRFDIISHPVRLGFSVPGIPECVRPLLDEIADVAAGTGVALELNGSDLRRRPDLVELLADVLSRHDAPISLGSDAHLPGAVGCIRGVVPWLRERGVTQVARFERRELQLVPLPPG
jgi:histidinol phosphatase-like PHP family hydrolase